MNNLYAENSPARFWRVLSDPETSAAEWDGAVRMAAAALPATARAGGDGIDHLLQQTLGEGQFGPDHWRLSRSKRIYYELKPFLPRALIRAMRRGYHKHEIGLQWPIESRYARFQRDIMGHLLALTERPSLPYIGFWPGGAEFSFVLTHDVETRAGQEFVRTVADLDARYGFRSSFNFVPERYEIDQRLIDELRGRGFEIGVHGLKHDGKLFRSFREFMRRAQRINGYMRELGAVGFRAPLTHRHPGWMQALDIEYDLSFFDTDPFEPIAGGTMSIWPFTIGHFLELPYTLVQDYTLTDVLGETTPRIWLDKVEFIAGHSGMALLNTHPDYLRSPVTWRVYEEFLRAMQARTGYWHALPREIARWWRARADATSETALPGAVVRSFGVSQLAKR